MITGNEPAGVFSTHERGLTKREYFAGLAMQGLMDHGIYSNGDCHMEKYANDAVKMADALIAELNKEG